MINPGIQAINITKYDGDAARSADDLLAVEEPLEISLAFGPAERRTVQNLSITMRTPGADEDLAAGFLFTEGIITQTLDIAGISTPALNVVQVALSPGVNVDMNRLSRHFYTTSSCGVCGKSSVDALRTTVCFPVGPDHRAPMPRAEVLYRLPHALRQAQNTFEATGGLHASAIFDRAGTLLALREDVGRHNALDKLIGHYFRQDALPLHDHILLLSGRASFELIQKAAMAGIRVVGAVGAPSSLAVETAASFGMTLIGFLRDERFNLYTA
jgi:FdhD protein